MRHLNPLSLVALLVVVLATVVSITPAGARAQSFPSSITLIKGKIVAKNSDTHYFVLSFTCSMSSPSGNIGNWTYEVDSTLSLTGTVDWGASCPISSTGGQVNFMPPTTNLMGCGGQCNTNPKPTLTLSLMNIAATKTFFNLLTPMALCSSSFTPPMLQPCLDIEASGFSIPPPSNPPNPSNDFSSQCASFPCNTKAGFPYATLNLSAR